MATKKNTGKNAASKKVEPKAPPQAAPKNEASQPAAPKVDEAPKPPVEKTDSDDKGADSTKAKKTDPAAKASVKTYSVMHPLRYNGDKFAVGDTVDMDPAEAAELIRGGTLAEPTE